MYSQDTKIFQLIPPVKFLFIQAYVHAVSGGFFFFVFGVFLHRKVWSIMNALFLQELTEQNCIIPGSFNGTFSRPISARAKQSGQTPNFLKP